MAADPTPDTTSPPPAAQPDGSRRGARDEPRRAEAGEREAAPLWRSPALVLVGGVVLGTAVVSFMRVPLLPALRGDLHLSTRDLATITTVFAAGRLLMDLPAGRIVDRFAPAVGLVGSNVGLGVGALLVATAGSLAQVLAGIALIGIGSSITNTSGMTVFATSAPAARRGAAMAGFQGALLTGQTLGPALGGVLAGIGGWRLAQGAGAGIAALMAAAVLLSRVGRERTVGRRPPQSRAAAARDPDPITADGLTRVQAGAISAVPFVTFFAFGGMTQTLLPIVGDAELGLSVAAIGLLIGLGGLARFAGAMVAGRVSDRVSRKAALIPGLLVMAAGAALLGPQPTRGSWLAAIALLSLGSSGISVAATLIADRVPAARLGRSLAGYRFTGDVGLLAGPAVAGSLYASAGRPAAMLVTAALLAACALAVTLLVTEREVA